MVVAQETTLRDLLEGSKQYLVPLYQRTYSWTRPQLERLWEDVSKLAEDRTARPSSTHFIGSLVLAPSPTNGPAGVAQYLVVDGQQRLTTLTLLLCALRDHRAKTEHAGHQERVNELYLTNKWKPESQRLKLLPTQADRDAYIACIDATPQAGGPDAIGAAYRYFCEVLASADDPEDPDDIERIEDAVISGLALVSVTAQPGDNAHRIFESLNNTGLKLSQGDLLRNYLFMRLPTRAEAVYTSLWLPLQTTLSGDELELLFWLDLVQSDARIKQTDVYAGQQARLDRLEHESEIEAEVARFARLGRLVKVMLDPTQEPDEQVRLRLRRLNEWGTTTVYPLVLHLLDRRDQGSATSAAIAQALLYVESYFVRRLLINRATSGINRVLVYVVTEMDKTLPVDEAVHAYLSAGRKYYASDPELQASVQTVPFYLIGRAQQRSLVLRWLEESYGSKEPVDLSSLTIEHVMPQTLSATWVEDLSRELEVGETVESAHQAVVHTLGNLTLSGYNSSLSNSPFATKKAKLAESGLRMNQQIAREPRWTRAEIHRRASDLIARVTEIWPPPASRSMSGSEPSDARWDLLDRALAELPSGAWTTYGDVAALIGSHPVPVGNRVANHPVPNAHRVLRIDGTLSPEFRWTDPQRTDDPRVLLESEGVRFDDQGRADPAQRFTMIELAELCGVTVDSSEPREPSSVRASRERFFDQLVDRQSAGTVEGVRAFLDAWEEAGGALHWGDRQETSCFVMARVDADPRGSIWPMTVYPSGKVEIVFQYMATRRPFDDIEMRDEFRRRLNQVPGIDLPHAKLALRPGFHPELLANENMRGLVLRHSLWFMDQARASPR